MGHCTGCEGGGALYRMWRRWGIVQDVEEVGHCTGCGGGGALYRMWRWGIVQDVKEVGHCTGCEGGGALYRMVYGVTYPIIQLGHLPLSCHKSDNQVQI